MQEAAKLPLDEKKSRFREKKEIALINYIIYRMGNKKLRLVVQRQRVSLVFVAVMAFFFFFLRTSSCAGAAIGGGAAMADLLESELLMDSEINSIMLKNSLDIGHAAVNNQGKPVTGCGQEKVYHSCEPLSNLAQKVPDNCYILHRGCPGHG